MKRLVMVLIVSLSAASAAAGQSVVHPVLRTAPLFNYEDAPATPDADDPAIWINRRNHKQSLIIGTAKDAGLLVYDLSGQLVQAMFPPNAPQVTAADPKTPAGSPSVRPITRFPTMTNSSANMHRKIHPRRTRSSHQDRMPTRGASWKQISKG